MTAELLAFPRARHVRFVRRCAEAVATSVFPEQGKARLEREIVLVATLMAVRGLPQAAIDREIVGIRAAVQARVWALVLTPDGADGVA